MSWNPGMEPGADPPDYLEPYPAPADLPGIHEAQPGYGQAKEYDPYAPPPGYGPAAPANPYAPPPGYGAPAPGYPDPPYAPAPPYAPVPPYDTAGPHDAESRYAGLPASVARHGYPPDPGYAQDAEAWEPEYGPQDGDPDDEPPPHGRTVTPLRAVAFVALVVSAVVAAVSLLVLRGEQSIPITVAALAIFGLMATLVGIAVAAAGVRAAGQGRVRRGFFGGLLGGFFVLAASGAVASAVIFALLSRP